jgi:putative MFS transporter
MVSVLGVVVLIVFVDKVGRRMFTVPPLWIILVMFLVIGLWSSAPPIFVLVLFLTFSFLSGLSGPMTAIYPGELFPTTVRGKATGFAAAFSRVGAAIGTFFVPVGIENLGVSAVILILAGVVAVGAIISHLWAPETMGKDLSETSAGYQG